MGVGAAVRFSGKREYFGEILVPCSLIALSTLFFAITFSFPAEKAGPAAVPRLWVFWTVVLYAVILWQVFMRETGADPQSGRLGFLLLVIVILIADYFALALFGLATVASMGSGNVLKALVAILFGLLVKTIGIDPISGVSRFTFGSDILYDGFTLIPALIGLFAVSVVFAKVEEWTGLSRVMERVDSKLPSVIEFWKIKWTVFFFYLPFDQTMAVSSGGCPPE